jgi:hypothetical protein
MLFTANSRPSFVFKHQSTSNLPSTGRENVLEVVLFYGMIDCLKPRMSGILLIRILKKMRDVLFPKPRNLSASDTEWVFAVHTLLVFGHHPKESFQDVIAGLIEARRKPPSRLDIDRGRQLIHRLQSGTLLSNELLSNFMQVFLDGSLFFPTSNDAIAAFYYLCCHFYDLQNTPGQVGNSSAWAGPVLLHLEKMRVLYDMCHFGLATRSSSTVLDPPSADVSRTSPTSRFQATDDPYYRHSVQRRTPSPESTARQLRAEFKATDDLVYIVAHTPSSGISSESNKEGSVRTPRSNGSVVRSEKGNSLCGFVATDDPGYQLSQKIKELERNMPDNSKTSFSFTDEPEYRHWEQLKQEGASPRDPVGMSALMTRRMVPELPITTMTSEHSASSQRPSSTQPSARKTTPVARLNRAGPGVTGLTMDREGVVSARIVNAVESSSVSPRALSARVTFADDFSTHLDPINQTEALAGRRSPLSKKIIETAVGSSSDDASVRVITLSSTIISEHSSSVHKKLVWLPEMQPEIPVEASKKSPYDYVSEFPNYGSPKEVNQAPAGVKGEIPKLIDPHDYRSFFSEGLIEPLIAPMYGSNTGRVDDELKSFVVPALSRPAVVRQMSDKDPPSPERNIFGHSLVAFSDKYSQPLAYDISKGEPVPPGPISSEPLKPYRIKLSPSKLDFPRSASLSPLVSELFVPADPASSPKQPKMFDDHFKLVTPPPVRSKSPSSPELRYAAATLVTSPSSSGNTTLRAGVRSPGVLPRGPVSPRKDQYYQSLNKTKSLVFDSLTKSGMSPERSKQLTSQIMGENDSAWSSPRTGLAESVSRLEAILTRAEVTIKDGDRLREIKSIVSEIRDLAQ